MPDDLDVTDDVTTTDEPADETAEGASPADEASPADSPAEEVPAEEVELTPEQKAEAEKEAKRAARLKAADDAEKRNEAARKQRQAKREEEERETRVRARERQAEDTIRRGQELVQELEQRKAAVLKGGYEGLKALGIEYGDWTKKTLDDTSPDALARQAIERAERLEAEIKRRDDAERQRKEAAEAQESAKRFEAFVDSNAEDYPDAAALTSRMTHVLAEEAAAEYKQRHGTWPSFSALLPILDRKAKEFHDEQKSKASKRSTPTSDTPSDGATTQTQAKKPGLPANAPANRTLTPATATTKAKPPRQMTPDEEDEWALNELRQALKADKQSERADA